MQKPEANFAAKNLQRLQGTQNVASLLYFNISELLFPTLKIAYGA
jgi:hypothetical protein